MCRWCGCSCECSGPRSAERAVPVEGMLEGVLLLLLVEEPRYGYELWSLIEEEDLLAGRVYVGRIYEMLRRLLESGFVVASPEESTKGPPRSRYEVTPLGRERLERWRVGLNRSHDRIGQFLARCEQLPGDGASRPTPKAEAISGVGPAA
ncbi:MAG: PadR family transcriptional regulator [Actinobacteria bacterium]|nr:MAG: PadR family transcriptional regulator [Actinomycetota bacterium]